MKKFNASLKRIIVAMALAMGLAQLKAEEVANINPLITVELTALTQIIKEAGDINRKLFSRDTKKAEIAGLKGQVKSLLPKIDKVLQDLDKHPDHPTIVTFKGIVTELNGFQIDWNSAIQETRIQTAKMAAVVNNYAAKRDAKIRKHLFDAETGLKAQLEAETNQTGLGMLKQLLGHIDALLKLDHKALGHDSEIAMALNLATKGFSVKKAQTKDIRPLLNDWK